MTNLKGKVLKRGEELADGVNDGPYFNSGFQAAFEMLWPLVDALDKIMEDSGLNCECYHIAKNALADLEKKVEGE